MCHRIHLQETQDLLVLQTNHHLIQRLKQQVLMKQQQQVQVVQMPIQMQPGIGVAGVPGQHYPQMQTPQPMQPMQQMQAMQAIPANMGQVVQNGQQPVAMTLVPMQVQGAHVQSMPVQYIPVQQVQQVQHVQQGGIPVQTVQHV